MVKAKTKIAKLKIVYDTEELEYLVEANQDNPYQFVDYSDCVQDLVDGFESTVRRQTPNGQKIEIRISIRFVVEGIKNEHAKN